MEGKVLWVASVYGLSGHTKPNQMKLIKRIKMLILWQKKKSWIP